MVVEVDVEDAVRVAVGEVAGDVEAERGLADPADPGQQRHQRPGLRHVVLHGPPDPFLLRHPVREPVPGGRQLERHGRLRLRPADVLVQLLDPAALDDDVSPPVQVVPRLVRHEPTVLPRPRSASKKRQAGQPGCRDAACGSGGAGADGAAMEATTGATIRT